MFVIDRNNIDNPNKLLLIFYSFWYFEKQKVAASERLYSVESQRYEQQKAGQNHYTLKNALHRSITAKRMDETNAGDFTIGIF